MFLDIKQSFGQGRLKMLSGKQHYIYWLQTQIQQHLLLRLPPVIVDHQINPLHNFFIRCEFLQYFLLIRILFIFRLNLRIRLSELSRGLFSWRLLLAFRKRGCWLLVVLAVFKLMTSWSRHTLPGWRGLLIGLNPILYLLFPGEPFNWVGGCHRDVIRAHLTMALRGAQWILWHRMRLLWQVGSQGRSIIAATTSKGALLQRVWRSIVWQQVHVWMVVVNVPSELLQFLR